MSPLYKLLGALFLIGAVIGGIKWYGHSQYQAGHAQAELEAKAATSDLEKKYRQQETEAIKQSEQKYEKALDEKRKTDAANRTLDGVAVGLRGQLAVYKRRLSEDGTNPGGSIATGEVGIDVFGECSDRYSGMAQEAGRLADKVNALIDQTKK